MHELAITQSLFELVMEQAKQAEARKVGKINLVIGEMTGVVSDCVQFYFDLISKETLAEGAALSFAMIPARAQCRGREQLFTLKEFDWTCPHCGGNRLQIVAGKELFVESIEVE